MNKKQGGHRHDTKPKKHEGYPKKTLLGIISTTGKGMGFVAIEGNEEDVLVEPENIGTALHGDEVKVELLPKRKGERQQGKVVGIVKRRKTEFVGTADATKGGFYIVPDNKKIYTDIFVEENLAGKTNTGDKVLVEITGWKANAPFGKIVSIIGKKGEHNVEMESIILERGIETAFPHDVEREAKEVKKRETPLPQEEIAKRLDMRSTWTVTIDPKTAKDFDDAISFKKLGNGLFEIGVHIADVSYYVREGSALDKEARKRGLSVYLVDRTIPMLPEILSNDLCSLNPDEDKFAFGAIFTMDIKGVVHSRKFSKTIIKSCRRFTYEEAQESINGNDKDTETMKTLNTIAKSLREEKTKNGAIDFEQDEVVFELDSHGVPLKIVKKERLDAHKLVEEYMLLANREVAKYIHTSHAGKGISLYRIHDVPDQDRIAELSLFVKMLGHDLPIAKDGSVSPHDITKMLKAMEGKTEESLIRTATIRTMAKAIYSTKNIGHFGLGFSYYTHFTSPIRRYPDLVVHRILNHIISKEKVQARHDFNLLERIAKDSSNKEIDASEAERASIKYKQVEFMSKKVGQTFDGIISGVTEWGMYVEEKETKSEGLIRLKEMTDDFYTLDEKQYALKGMKTGKKYALGDPIRVKLVKADLDAKTLDFVLTS